MQLFIKELNVVVEAKTKTHMTRALNKILLKIDHNVESYYKLHYDDGRVCGICGKPIRLKLDYENGVIINKEQNYICDDNHCPVKLLNPRSYEYMIKVRGIPKDEAIEFSKSIARKSYETSINNKPPEPKLNPFSKQYWIAKGYSNEDAQLKVNERNIRCVEFWLKKGYKFENAKRMSDFHTKTATKEFYMYYKGFSEDEAELIMKEISENKKAVVYSNPNCTRNSLKNNKDTKEARLWLGKIISYLDTDGILPNYYAEFNEDVTHKEWFVNGGDFIYFYDLVIPSFNLVVEYNGIHVHPNKDELTLDQWDSWRDAFSKQTADEKYAKDQHKEEVIKSKFGFKNYFRIWSNWSDERKDQEIQSILNCVYKHMENEKC